MKSFEKLETHVARSHSSETMPGNLNVAQSTNYEIVLTDESADEASGCNFKVDIHKISSNDNDQLTSSNNEITVLVTDKLQKSKQDVISCNQESEPASKVLKYDCSSSFDSPPIDQNTTIQHETNYGLYSNSEYFEDKITYEANQSEELVSFAMDEYISSTLMDCSQLKKVPIKQQLKTYSKRKFSSKIVSTAPEDSSFDEDMEMEKKTEMHLISGDQYDCESDIAVDIVV